MQKIKKFMALAVALILCLGATMLVGCGNSSFLGLYKEADAQTLSTFTEKVENAQSGTEMPTEIEGYNGVRGNIKISVATIKAGEVSAEVSQSVKLKASWLDDTFKTNAVIEQIDNTEGDEKNKKFTFWYDGVTGYVLGEDKIEGKEIKGKKDIGDSAALGGLLVSEINWDVTDLISYCGKEGVKIYLDEGARTNKVKIVFDEFSDNLTKINGKMFFVYDENYNVIAIKGNVDMEMLNNNDGIRITMEYKVEKYNGAISIPDKVKEYPVIDDLL